MTAAPYTLDWNAVPAGNYSLSAKVTDGNGLTATSAAVTIVVNAKPGIDLTSPTGTQSFSRGSTILLQATATDSDGTIAKVEFHEGGRLLGTATTAPYSLDWSDVGVGNYSLTAKATDDRGAETTSAAVAGQLHQTEVSPRSVSR